MRRRTRLHRNAATGGGFALIQMVAAMSLVGVFVIAAGQLTMQCVQLWQELGTREASVHRLEQVMRRLQQDAWSADQVRAATPHRLVLVRPGGERITWRADAEEPTLRRELEGGEAEEWWFDRRSPFMFDATANAAHLISGGHTATFISQVRAVEVDPAREDG